METILFTLDDGSTEEFLVEEQTVIAGKTYLLVSRLQDSGEDAYAYIMKDTSSQESPQAIYEMVEDEEEVSAVFDVFRQMLAEEDVVLEE
ncbi:MAG: DUF1292 domain-containing protein [Blautia sp.]|nr:DUF1292 domain-containing protein [Blautia sp.]